MQLKKISSSIIISFLLFVSISFANPSPPADTTIQEKVTKSSNNPIGNMLLKSISLIGTPYKKNGTNPAQGLDDAGFIHYVFLSSMGINLPNTTQEISKIGKSINIQEVEPGDLLFFNTKYGPNTYVVIYLGNNKFIQASPVDDIKITEISSSWRDRINIAKRIVQENEDDGGNKSFESFQAVNTTSEASIAPKPPADSLINTVEISCDYLIKKHKYKEGLPLCLKNAMAGERSAQTNLGDMYNYGNGVAKDYQEAFLWYSKAADQGDSYAQYNLGDMYYAGNGVAQDYQEAFLWYSKAADQGDSYAQYNLGYMYYTGNGVVQNYQVAIQWYTKSANQGNAIAQQQLIVMQQYNEISIFDQINLTTLSLGILLILIFGTIGGIVIYKFSKPNYVFIKNGYHKINKLCRRLAIIIAILSLIPVSTIVINNTTSSVIGVMEGIVNVIAYFLLYLELDKIFLTKLTRLYILSIILSGICLVALGIGYFTFISSSASMSTKIITLFISYITCFLFPIIIAYKTGLNIDIIAESTSNHLFGYSAKLMKVAAYTMPIFIGVLILLVAQILFLFACIMDDTITLPKN